MTLDVFPYREDKIPTVKNCFAWLAALESAVERTELNKIGAVAAKCDANEAVALVREILIGDGR